jgi:hypothetical protein
VRGYYARTRTPGGTGDAASYMGEVLYNADRYGLAYQHLSVGDDFNPEIGFLRRSDFRRHYTGVRFSPRPAGPSRIRRVFYEANLDYITNGDYRLETREAQGAFSLEFQNSDRFELEYTDTYEYLEEPFEIASGVEIPQDGYPFRGLKASYQLGTQHRVAGTLTAGHGTFYDGTKSEASYQGRVEISPRLMIEPRLSLNLVDLPWGEFTATVASARTILTFSPRTFLSGLVQYNSSSDALSASVRFRWEYQPGSDLFVVFTEGRDTDGRGFPTLQNRGFVVKLTRLFRL